MHEFTKKAKRIKLTYVAASCIVTFILMISFSWFDGIYSSDFADNYYTIYINGVKAGSTDNYNDIDTAMEMARKRINSESENPVYVKADIQVKTCKRIVAKSDSETDLENNIYDNMKLAVEDSIQKAYVVNIGGYNVTLGSLADVEYLFESIRNKYDSSGEFSTDLHLDDYDGNTSITCDVKKANVQGNPVNLVAAAENSENQDNQNGSATQENADGTMNVEFAESVNIVPSYVSANQIMEPEEALDMLTADGSTSEISVLVTEKKTYTEEYSLETQYIFNDKLYANQINLVTNGNSGTKQITANISYKNGVEVSRDILQETVISPAVATVIEMGTEPVPTYIKPISSGYMSSGFGARWGTFHKGVDWACNTGTSVKASCGGKVVTAGWVNGYGNCVELSHSDGKHTRYGHLSKVLVAVGDKVEQGDEIALSGNTGDSTGPHLHFEIIVNGVQVNPFDYLQ